MAQSIANLAIDLTANIAGFQSDLGKADREANKFAKKLEKDFQKAGVAIGTAFAAGFAAVAVGVTQTLERLDKLGDVSKRIKVSTEALSALGYAAKLSGSSAEALETGLAKLSKGLGEAATGNEKLAQLFDVLNIALTDTADVAAVKLGKALAGIDDGSVRVALATKAMGKGATELIPLLVDLGERGFNDVTEEARKFGAVVSSDTVAAAQKFGDNLDNLKTLGQAAFVTLSEIMLPTLIDVTEGMVRFIQEAKESGDLQRFADAVADVVRAIDDLARGLAAFIAARYLITLGVGAAQLATALGGVGVAAGIARAGLAAIGGPITLVAGAVAAAVVLHNNYSESLRINAERAEAATSSISRLNSVMGETELSKIDAELNAARSAAAELFKTVDEGLDNLAEIKSSRHGNISDIVGANAQNQKLLDELISKIAALRKRRDELAAQQRSSASTEKDAAKRAEELSRIIGGLSVKTADAAKQTSWIEKAMNAAKKAADPFALSVNKLTQSWERFQTSIANAGQELRDQQITEGMARDLEEATRASDEAAMQWEATWGNLYESLGAAFGDFIAGNLESWEDFGDALNSIAKNFLSDLVRRFASTSLRMGSSGGGGTFSNNQLWGNSSSVFGGQGFSWQGAGNAAAGIYSTYQQSQAGNQGGAAFSGAMTGAQIGTMIMPGIGTAVGAIIGALVGWFATNTDVPSITLIGSDLIGQSPYRNLAPDARFTTQLGEFAFASIDEVDAAGRAQLRKAVTDFDNLIASFLDDEQLAKVKEALETFNLQLEDGAITAENFIQARFDAILGTFDEATQEMVRGAGDIEAQIRKLGEVLQYPKLLKELLDSLGEADTLAGMTEFERGIYQINKNFDEARDAAELLGATEEELAEIELYRANALDRLAKLQAQQLDDLLDPLYFEEFTEGMSESEKEIARITKYFDDLYEQAVELGASEEQLALIRRRQAAAIADVTEAAEENIEVLATLPDIFDAMDDDFGRMADRVEDFRQAAEGVADFLDGQIFGTSSASPLARLQAAQDQFASLARAAGGGDIDAIRDLPGVAQRLLQEASTFFGVGSSQFQGIEGFIRSVLDPIGQIANSTDMADVQGRLVQSLQALNSQLARQGQPGTTDPNLLREVARVSTAIAETNRLLGRIATGENRPRVTS